MCDHFLVGVARVDDERQPRLAGSRDMRAEHLSLHLARAAVVVIVEARFADRDAARMSDSATIFSAGTSGSSAALCGWVPTVKKTCACASAIAR